MPPRECARNRGDAATQQTVDPRSGETLALGWQVFTATKLFWPRAGHGRGSDSGLIEVLVRREAL